MTSNAKKKYKSWLCIIKKNIWENIVSFISLNNIPAPKLMQAYRHSVSFSYFFHFLLIVSKPNVNFFHKHFPIRTVSQWHLIRNWKVLLMKVEILGLETYDFHTELFVKIINIFVSFRYHGRWIDSGNRALTLALWKKTPSTYTFSESWIVIEYNHMFEIF